MQKVGCPYPIKKTAKYAKQTRKSCLERKGLMLFFPSIIHEKHSLLKNVKNGLNADTFIYRLLKFLYIFEIHLN